MRNLPGDSGALWSFAGSSSVAPCKLTDNVVWSARVVVACLLGPLVEGWQEQGEVGEW